MDTRRYLHPGQNGTKRLVRQYGGKLICVRYRNDARSCQRHKTIKLVEENVSWHWHSRGSRERHLMQRAAGEPVLVKIDYNERELRETVKPTGGHRQPDEKA